MNEHDADRRARELKRQRRRRLLATLGVGLAGAYVVPTLFSLGQAHAWHGDRRYTRPSYTRPSYTRPSYSRPSRPRRRSIPHVEHHHYYYDDRPPRSGRYLYQRTRYSRPSRW